MILDLNPQQIITEGNAKFQHPRFRKNRETIQVHHLEGTGMNPQDLQVPEIKTTKNNNGGKGN